MVPPRVQIHVLDPAAYTPPYDHALCHALAAAGDDVTLVTARFPHGEVPDPDGYTIRTGFYRGSERLADHRARRAARLLQHLPDMERARRRANAEADVAHFQWLAVQAVDARLLKRWRTPLVLTAHDVLPREPRPGQLDAQRRLYEQVDAVVVHTEHGRRRLTDDLGIPTEQVHVIRHGVLSRLLSVPAQRPPELPEPTGERPVVLFFGLLKPYKGLDVLAEAWRRARPDAELWVVGAPRSAPPPLPPDAHTALRFVSEQEAAWCFAHADVVVLPYREIEQSGVLFTALAFARALILSDVGGFNEVPDTAALHVAPGDPDDLARALKSLAEDPETRQRLSHGARLLAQTDYAWGPIAAQHRALYGRLTGR